jgi:hypothetical protein
MWPATDSTEGSTGDGTQLEQVLRTEIWDRVVFEVAPKILDGIELRSVGGEPLDLEPVAMLPDELSDLPASMNGQAIPDDQQAAWELLQQAAKKVDGLGSFDRTWVEAKVEVPPGYPCDRRKGVPVEVELEDRGTAAGCPGSASVGSLAETALVDEDNGLSSPGSVFFTLGQRARFQCSMLSSSRSSARPTGRWTLHFNRRRIFQMWPGW